MRRELSAEKDNVRQDKKILQYKISTENVENSWWNLQIRTNLLATLKNDPTNH